jgi:hypothetical protein
MSPSASIGMYFLKCAVFLLVPGVTLGLGIWLIKRFIHDNARHVQISWSVIVGVIVAELFLLGVFLDPRTDLSRWMSYFNTAVVAAVGGFVIVMVFLPSVKRIIGLIRDINKPKDY